MQHKIIVYADGACRNNPGPGGWGAILYNSLEKKVWELGGHDSHTTNNRMELQAVIESLQNINSTPGDLEFYLDSQYVLKGVTEWMETWKKRNWMSSGGSEIANRDLWEKLHPLVQKRKDISSMEWKYVPGHAGIPGNERADAIAQAFADQKKIQLYNGASQKYPLDFSKTQVEERAKKKNKGSSKQAYSYLSFVDGTLQRHQTWQECYKRVHGVSGAKFKKALSSEEEVEIIRQWGLDPSHLPSKNSSH